MRILHIVTLAEIGGAQSVVLNLAKESAVFGNQVMVASSVKGELWNLLPKEVLQWKIPSLKRSIRLGDDLRVIRELRKINITFRPDVIHLHSSKIGVLGRLAFPTQKIVYTVHGFDSIRLAFRKFLYLEKLLQTRSKHIVGVSKYDVNNLMAEGIKSNVKCIYNGISDFFQFHKEKETELDEELRHAIQSKKGFKVLCIARISAQKKFDLFCEVAEQMKDYPVHFFWIGNKEQVYDTPENVHCLGQVENAHRFLKYVDLFMLPSNYEGMPVSIIEALCYSVPVVASNVGGIPEMLNGRNGVALKNDRSTFVSAISEYIENKDLLDSSRFEARKSYENFFTIRIMFEAYMKLYESIYSENHPLLVHSIL
ncbi:glycosyltransferase [Dyadobacter arcticus]|uniref:Glycosyltransferase involved in cell wall biosynthesis n=1 Tax=Dyadobacter arcticus TaxID=1078754 RepID=A0ABX0UTL9_9BACT|nr:glycosyltransferase [Dyadobacter arcticus]NIJ55753.1 glycosyltransferase involved in cell wall biosynthesis [Dyadobacter arcticus]